MKKKYKTLLLRRGDRVIFYPPGVSGGRARQEILCECLDEIPLRLRFTGFFMGTVVKGEVDDEWCNVTVTLVDKTKEED